MNFMNPQCLWSVSHTNTITIAFQTNQSIVYSIHSGLKKPKKTILSQAKVPDSNISPLSSKLSTDAG